MSCRVLFMAAALALTGCDRVAQQWPFHAAPASVTVKLPPPRTAAPGFAFGAGRKAGPPPFANGT